MSWRDNIGSIGAGGFVEWFGGFYFDSPDGSWDVPMLSDAIDIIQSASAAGLPVVLKANPGPGIATFEHRFESDPQNFFTVTGWAGADAVPATAAGCRQAMADRLIESLALFLIVVEPNVFWSYAWFYGIEDGYIPCPSEVQCGMPSRWYDEFSRPLGPPMGPANKSGTVFRRQFAHASVYVDLSSRAASRIVWTTPSVAVSPSAAASASPTALAAAAPSASLMPAVTAPAPIADAPMPPLAPVAVSFLVVGALAGVAIILIAVTVGCRRADAAGRRAIFVKEAACAEALGAATTVSVDNPAFSAARAGGSNFLAKQ